MSATSQGKTKAIDTKGNAPEDAQQKFMWAVQKAQTGNKLKLPWTKLGKFFRLQVLNPFIKKPMMRLLLSLKMLLNLKISWKDLN